MSSHDWKPIDLSHGAFRDREIHNASKFRRQENKDLRAIVRNPIARKEVVQKLMGERKGGMTRVKLKKDLKALRADDTISQRQVRQIKRNFGAR